MLPSTYRRPAVSIVPIQCMFSARLTRHDPSVSPRGTKCGHLDEEAVCRSSQIVRIPFGRAEARSELGRAPHGRVEGQHVIESRLGVCFG